MAFLTIKFLPQSLAIRGNGFGVFLRFRSASIFCHRKLLHKSSPDLTTIGTW
jgi:hypothetical protein